MRIAIFHNYYKLRGGEDEVFELECQTLKDEGHEVFPFVIRNKDVLSDNSFLNKAKVAWQSSFNPVSYDRVVDFLKKHKPDVGHVHNWFPVLSPAVYAAHSALGIPVVQTLHNYRLGCAAGTYRRNGSDCDLCLTGSRWSAVKNRCYRGSLVGSLAWKRMADRGWNDHTFTKGVSRYIAPSKEVARRHIRMGIDESRISIIPNACNDTLTTNEN